MMPFAVNSKRIIALVAVALLMFAPNAAAPISAFASVKTTLVDENHQPASGSLDINSLEGKKFIICCKGSDKALHGLTGDLYDQQGKRIEKGFKLTGRSMTCEVGHYDVEIEFLPSTLTAGKTYRFKLVYTAGNDSSVVDETSILSVTLGADESKDDSDKKDDDKDDGSQDEDKGEEKKEEQDNPDQKRDDSEQSQERQDAGQKETESYSGKKGHGKTNGSASGSNHGRAGALKNSSKNTNGFYGLSGQNADSADDDDDSGSSDTANSVEAVEDASSKKASEHKNGNTNNDSDAGYNKMALASLGDVYSLSDDRSPVIAESGGDSNEAFLDVTGTPWLFAVLASIMGLALPAGLGLRFFLDKQKLVARSRLGGYTQNANDTERQDN